MSNNSESVIRAQKRKKQHAVDVFGGKCCRCGYNKCVDALEFHHLDKTTKEEKPSYVIMRWSWERAKKELDKCILVCSNCHKEIHAAEVGGKDLRLQQHLVPWISKICETCDCEFETRRKEQRFCSISCSSIRDRGGKRPPKEVLKGLLDDETTTWVSIGKMYRVSDNAVRKWAKKYELI